MGRARGASGSRAARGSHRTPGSTPSRQSHDSAPTREKTPNADRRLDLHTMIAVGLIAGIVAGVFARTLAFGWLNWDDQQVFVRDAALHAPGLAAWAFTTTLIDHYQPLGWIAWGGLDRLSALTPAAAHALNVVLHVGCAVLVFALARRLGLGGRTATFAALLFAVHPLRVEVVAWASAMPYALALLFALASVLAYLAGMTTTAILCYALSLLARPVALGLPAALLALGWWTAARTGGRLQRATVVRSLAPFFALAVVGAYLEAHARPTATLADIGIPARLTLASTAAFRYLWKSVVPVGLTPLDPLALHPQADLILIAAGTGGLVGITALVWRLRRTHPGALPAWVSFVALLAPAMGFVPSGLQATADRYTYLPAVPLSLFAAALISDALPRLAPTRWVLPAAATAIVGLLAATSIRQSQYWRDSVSLWTRAVQVTPASDVALYNLGSALAEAGRRDEAIARYEDVLRIVPDHDNARRNRDVLRAAALEDAGNSLAAAGRLADAIERYRAAIALDAARTHSQAALGMALVQSGRAAEALPYLREAVRLGTPEPSVANALAFSLVQTGRTTEACDVLLAARARFPSDDDIRRNLDGLAKECGR
jgi:Flp pilus assembly protein TadD